MLELTTSSTTNMIYQLYGIYIDWYGKMKSFDYEFTANVNTNLNQSAIWQEVAKEYSNKVLNLRGLSNFNKITHDIIDLPDFKVKSKNQLINYKDSFYPCYGDATLECIKMSIQHEACGYIQAAGGSYENAVVNITEREVIGNNCNKLNLIVFGDNGFELMRGKITHEFYEDRNATCVTCQEGLSRYYEILDKIGSHLIAHNDKVVFSGQYINDFNLDNDTVISESIKTNFYPILELAKIKNVYFERF